MHVDARGHLHICQGLSIGNLLEAPLRQIMENYDPDSHPVIGPLLRGGPAEVVRQFAQDHRQGYADACHLCYLSRRELRGKFPDVLTPGQMYGNAKQASQEKDGVNGTKPIKRNNGDGANLVRNNGDVILTHY